MVCGCCVDLEVGGAARIEGRFIDPFGQWWSVGGPTLGDSLPASADAGTHARWDRGGDCAGSDLERTCGPRERGDSADRGATYADAGVEPGEEQAGARAMVVVGDPGQGQQAQARHGHRLSSGKDDEGGEGKRRRSSSFWSSRGMTEGHSAQAA
jgi:hypothetical protein